MNKYRHKYNIILCLVLFMVAALSSCDLEGDVDATLSQKATLKINGKMIIAKASIPTDGYGSSSDESNEKLTVNSVRILTFYNNSVVYNGLVEATGEWDSDSEAYIVSVNQNVDAYIGENTVYVVLNEDATLAEALAAIKTPEEMETLRTTGLITYEPDKFRITDESAEEPAFMMCTYDEIVVTSTAQVYDLTGLSNESFGFPMRRTMAKIVLDEIIGGVRPDGTIVGTDIKWNGSVENDQIVGDTENQDLIATSAVHILDVELINVPTKYSWKQDGSDLSTYPTYTGQYHTEAIPIATSDFNLTEDYFDREWPGFISGSGEVEFTRTDAMYSMWKVQQNSGKNAYAVYDPKDVEANPDLYYYWGITGGSIPVPNTGISCEITYADAMKTASNFSHYTIDENGYIHLFDTSGNEFSAPNNSMYTLNKGNFTDFFQKNYGNMSGNFVPGRPIAGAMKTTPYIDPSVWSLKFNNVSYYIPENKPKSTDNYTKLRITASIAIPTVELDPVEVNKAINEQGGTGELVGEEGMINMSDQNIINYLYAKGEMLPHPTKEGYYGLAYAGLKRMYKGTVTVSNADGRYEKMVGYDAQVVTFDILLNNDMVEGGYDNVKHENEKEELSTDHNIYRGHEYRVKLYVTRSNENWPSRSAEASSRTISIGGEELTITGKVVATPME